MSRAVMDKIMKGLVLEVLGKEEGEKVLQEFDPWTLEGYAWAEGERFWRNTWRKNIPSSWLAI